MSSQPLADVRLSASEDVLLAQLGDGVCRDPHALLGPHEAHAAGTDGVWLRAFHPDAVGCELLRDGRAEPMGAIRAGLFAVFVPGATPALDYRFRFSFSNGQTWERADPYAFAPSLGELDLHLISEGNHFELWDALGAHVSEQAGVSGARFAVWAPNATRVSVVGDFNGWDGRLLPMRCLSGGIWELFVPELGDGALYKFEIRTQSGALRLKTDPLARQMETSPGTASVVTESRHAWSDQAWQAARGTGDVAREPLNIYEVHLGSWRRVPEEDNRMLTYRELAEQLVPYVKGLGFTHIELMPVAEHAYYPSWGYQVTGYYAPTSRYGTPDDFKYFVDQCHQQGIGVIVDWVPAHFPKDDYALRRFDGSALYEHEDPRQGEHPDWGTLIFNVGRNEVRNFLLANALYWLRELHVDGLRVDAVASMLYLDFSRKPGEWIPNAWGGRENLDAVAFFRSVNRVVHERVPGAFTVAEESTAWPGVTASPDQEGLGFDFKWNMGWMHDTLSFFSLDPVFRKYELGRLTFSMVYEHHERFIDAISHDEVVYGKRALYEKMPGDPWQKLANLRLLLAYQFTRPGKKLSFMGTELAQRKEWNFDRSLDFHLQQEADGERTTAFIAALGELYRQTPALWERDPSAEGFRWIDTNDTENTVLSFIRIGDTSSVIVVLNFTPVPRPGYRLGVPEAGLYALRLSSDESRFGGSDYGHTDRVVTEPHPAHGHGQSLVLTLPPLACLVLARV